MWGSGGGVGGDVADLEGLGPQGGDERGGAGTLACGNGPGNAFFTETALLDEVHSTERFRENSAGMWQWCKETHFRLGQ